MVKEFLSNFTNHVLSVGQPLLFYLDKNLMTIKIKNIEGKLYKIILIILTYEI